MDNKYLHLFSQAIAKYCDGNGEYNRHKNQCLMLYELLDSNLKLYEELEIAIKFLNISYCPSTVNECHYILSRYRFRQFIDIQFKKLTGKDWDYRNSNYDFNGNFIKI